MLVPFSSSAPSNRLVRIDPGQPPEGVPQPRGERLLVPLREPFACPAGGARTPAFDQEVGSGGSHKAPPV